MDTEFQSLPPHKRFRAMHRQQLEQQLNESKVKSSQLPAKKRKECRSDSVEIENRLDTYCLPAKKRILAFQPDKVSGEPLFPFDLNVEYKSYFNEVEKNPDVEISNETEKPEEILKDEVQIDSLEDDDGVLCAICQSTDGDPSDPIVFCDGCDLMVHATCYGDPLIKSIPEGDWFCKQCLVSKASEDVNKGTSLSCCLCTNKGGAIKPTVDGRWAHVVCAVYIPEVFFSDPEGREGIDCSEVPDRRWKEKCYVCKKKNDGCVLECSEPKCPLAFHVTCGLKDNVCIEYKESKKKNKVIVAGFCKDHSELWEKLQQSGKFKIVARE